MQRSLLLLSLLVGAVFSDVTNSNYGWGWYLQRACKKNSPKFSFRLLNETLHGLSETTLCDADPEERSVLNEYVLRGLKLAEAADQRGEFLAKRGITLRNCPRSHILFFNPFMNAEATEASQRSSAVLVTTKLVLNDYLKDPRVTPNDFISFLESFRQCKISSTVWGEARKSRSERPADDRFRQIDGSSNNAEHSEWGVAGTTYGRLLQPRYADGLFALPASARGGPLPNPRALSTRLFPGAGAPSARVSYLGMQWGQLVTHDLAQLTMKTTEAGGGIMCCKSDWSGPLPPHLQHDACIPITIPKDDPFYASKKIACLNFVRSTTAPRCDCSLGPAEQMNTATSFLDCSTIYGSSNDAVRLVRSKVGGTLRTGHHQRLPGNPNPFKFCDFSNGRHKCYLAGDARVNQTPPLTLLQTILLREHNRLAKELKVLNNDWDDDTVFETARAILIAQVQHITYYQWLPIILGWPYLREHDIVPKTLFTDDYGNDIDPSILNEFSTAAFRFLHSQIPSQIFCCNRNGNITVNRLSDTFFNPNLMDIGADSFDSLLRGVCKQPANKVGQGFVPDIKNLLFRSNLTWGFDLVTMDIHRSRDHGIAGYNDYRKIVGIKQAKSFQDLSKEISRKNIATLQSLYADVDDIDLYVGGSLEQPVGDSLLGPTFTFIIGEQFTRTRKGDRFFYTLKGQPHSFTDEQLRELKKSSIARIILDNSDGIDRIQMWPFELASEYNPIVTADNIPSINLTYWQNNIN